MNAREVETGARVEGAGQVVGKYSELWEGELHCLRAFGEAIFLVKVGVQVKAYLDRCAHLGVKLSQGSLEGTILTCSAHHWQYDVATGKGTNPCTAQLLELPVSIDGDDIIVTQPPRLSSLSPRARKSSGARPQNSQRGDGGLRPRSVGPVLRCGKVARAIAAAVVENHRDAQVFERGAYIRILVREQCSVGRSAIERHLGEPFDLCRDLEVVLVSSAGQITLTETTATWSSS